MRLTYGRLRDITLLFQNISSTKNIYFKKNLDKKLI